MTATEKPRLRAAEPDEATEIDAGEPVKGPVYLARSTDEGYVISYSKVEVSENE